MANDDVVITVERHGAAPGTSTTLAKIVAKDEPPSWDKGKPGLYLESFENLDVNLLHQSYLTRCLRARNLKVPW